MAIPPAQTSGNLQSFANHVGSVGTYTLNGVYADGSTYLLTVSKRGNPDFKVTYIAPCPTCIATGAIITFNITTNFDVAPLIDTQINSPGGYYLGGLSATNEVDTVGFSFHDHSYAQASISVSLCSFTADVC